MCACMIIHVRAFIYVYAKREGMLVTEFFWAAELPKNPVSEHYYSKNRANSAELASVAGFRHVSVVAGRADDEENYNI